MDNLKKHAIQALVIIMLMIIPYLIFINLCFCDWENRGLFGDSFGAYNGIISSFALICLLFSLKQQNHMLELQKSELVLQRAEIEKQTKEFHEHTSLSVRNQFMEDFYRRLQLLDDQSKHLYFCDSSINKFFYGNEAWDYLSKETISSIERNRNSNTSINIDEYLNNHINSYTCVYTWYMSASNLVYDLMQMNKGLESRYYSKLYYMRILMHSMHSNQKDFFLYFLDLHTDEAKIARDIRRFMIDNEFLTPKNLGGRRYISIEDSKRDFLALLKKKMDV